MRSLIIGDVHARLLDELQRLLDASGLSDDDRIVSVGDMIDRGPNSAKVWRFFATTDGAEAIIGDREQIDALPLGPSQRRVPAAAHRGPLGPYTWL